MMKKNLLYGILAISIVAGTAIMWQTHQSSDNYCPNISDYTPERDRENITNLFHSELYWLVANPAYSVAYMLDNRAAKQYDPRTIGTLNIKVLYEQGAFAGFTAYYMKSKSLAQGCLLFLAVSPEFRGKHCGERLMHCAEQELKKMGARYVELVTRVENFKAQSLYKRVGYHEVHRDKGGTGFITYHKML